MIGPYRVKVIENTDYPWPISALVELEDEYGGWQQKVECNFGDGDTVAEALEDLSAAEKIDGLDVVDHEGNQIGRIKYGRDGSILDTLEVS